MFCPECCKDVEVEKNYHGDFAEAIQEIIKCLNKHKTKWKNYETFETQIAKLWTSYGLKIEEEKVEWLGNGRWQWTITAKKTE